MEAVEGAADELGESVLRTLQVLGAGALSYSWYENVENPKRSVKKEEEK